MKKIFSLGAILSVTTERLLVEMSELCKVLNFLTGDKLFSHQLPRANDMCKPWLLKQHPQLKDIDSGSVNKDNWKEFLDKQTELFGASLVIEQLPSGGYKHIDPAEEMTLMNPEINVIPVAGADRKE